MSDKGIHETLIVLQVQLNCHVTHPPYKYNGVIIQKDIHLITVSNDKGLTVSCDPLRSVCTVTLDGWLHGKMAGCIPFLWSTG